MPNAGDLRDRVRLQQRARDENGDRLGDFTDAHTVWAQIRYLRGSEPVVAARLQGQQPVVITVRASGQTRAVETSWRALNARSGEVYEISAVTPSDDRAWIDILAVQKGEG